MARVGYWELSCRGRWRLELDGKSGRGRRFYSVRGGRETRRRARIEFRAGRVNAGHGIGEKGGVNELRICLHSIGFTGNRTEAIVLAFINGMGAGAPRLAIERSGRRRRGRYQPLDRVSSDLAQENKLFSVIVCPLKAFTI